jgi:glycosyltransferase involved in cell wall biosynthesis
LGGKRVVAYVGSISLSSHPVDLLISAFPQVIRAVGNAVLLIVGGGEDLMILREQANRLGIEEAVCFVGRVAPDQVPGILCIADVSVDPVLENDVARARSPLKAFESLAVGTPVVTSDVGDRRSILNDGQAGLLVSPGSARELAKGILALLRDEERRQEAREAAAETCRRHYWDVLVHDFARVYEIIGGRAASFGGD